MIAAGMTGVEEIAIDKAEGDQFMGSAQNVMRHYSVQSSQKTIDWLAFGGTCCMIYGTRFGAYMLRKRSEQQENVKPGAVIYNMPVRAASPETPARQAPQQQPQPEAQAAPMEFEYQQD